MTDRSWATGGCSPPGASSRRGRARIAAVFAAASIVAGCGGGPPAIPIDASGRPDPVLESGRQIYGARCATCHGSEGAGGRGAKLDEGRSEELYPDLGAMVEVIAEGKGTGMPAFGERLSDSELEAVARYVREVLD